MEVMCRTRTSMNFCMLFATWVANLVLVIGRRFLVKSVIGIYQKCETYVGRMGFGGFTLDCQGKQPTSWRG